MKTKIYLIFILFVSSVFILSSCGSANTDPVIVLQAQKQIFITPNRICTKHHLL